MNIIEIPWPTLVTILSVIFVAGGFYWMTKSDMKLLKENVIAIKEDLKILNKAIGDIAVQNTRLDNHGAMLAATQKQQAILEDRIYKLSQGKGFMQKAINGEYE